MKRGLFLILLLCSMLLLGGCGQEEEKLITFSDSEIKSDLIGVSIDGTTLTITQSGTYTITGSCKEGNIIVDAPNGKSIELILNDLNLTCSKTAPIVIKDGSDDEDEETLQQRFQLRSRFSRAGMPNIPVIEKPSSLEASLPAPPKKPRNVAWKCAVKKLKLSEATRPEVSSTTSVVEYYR